MMKNSELVLKGFNILHGPMAVFICNAVKESYGPQLWWDRILTIVKDPKLDSIKWNGKTDEEKIASLDIANCLKLIDRGWNEFFRNIMPKKARSWANEALENRNESSNRGMFDFSDVETDRMLNTQALLCSIFDETKAEEIRKIIKEIFSSAAKREEKSNGKTKEKEKTSSAQLDIFSLPPWRNVIRPHDDIASNRYIAAEFAANLSDAAGTGNTEAADFFSRTFITNGIKRLLTEAFKRLSGENGDPVIQLKTVFGGGKTHSLLALFYATCGSINIDDVPELKEIVTAIGLSKLPSARHAILVGTDINPAKAEEPKDMPGVKINTLCGMMAYQLASASGKPEIYDFVREADAQGVSPGIPVLRDMFNAAGPCLILMDEIAEYGTKIYGETGDASIRFANFLNFIREVTEAVSQSKNSLLVASIPESETELHGSGAKETARTVRETIEKRFGRLEQVWNPVTEVEGFEVVRRRLFSSVIDTKARDAVCHAFAEMYRAGREKFPSEASDPAYEERMKRCYPIHPEVFDRLYKDWCSLDNFQRTRGVLRLMAALIADIWGSNDGSPLIMPCSFNIIALRTELLRAIPDSWNSIIDKEVDGRNAVPIQKDKKDAQMGQIQACLRTARTIFFGSAPTTKAQNAKGLSDGYINLGSAEPGHHMHVYEKAREALRNSLSFLYTEDGRYWYDTHPNLNRTMRDRAASLAKEKVAAFIADEIKKRENRHKEMFKGVIVWPAGSADVADDRSVRLVILGPDTPHSNIPAASEGAQSSGAVSAAKEIYDKSGIADRGYHNTLIFAAADAEKVRLLEEAARSYIAWDSICNDKEKLDLGVRQLNQAEDSRRKESKNLEAKIDAAYRWLIIPRAEEGKETAPSLDVMQMGIGESGITVRAEKKLAGDNLMISRLAPGGLLTIMRKYSWKKGDHISFGDLWNMFCKYCYMPRLTGRNVLEEAIREGVNGKFFALASAFDDGKYKGIKDDRVMGIDDTDLIVRQEVIDAQLAAEQREKNPPEPDPHPLIDPVDPPINPSVADPVPPHEKLIRHLRMSATIDNHGYAESIDMLCSNIVHHIMIDSGAKVTIKLEITADHESGISEDTLRTVRENCKVLNVDEIEFKG